MINKEKKGNKKKGEQRSKDRVNLVKLKKGWGVGIEKRENRKIDEGKR